MMGFSFTFINEGSRQVTCAFVANEKNNAAMNQYFFIQAS